MTVLCTFVLKTYSDLLINMPFISCNAFANFLTEIFHTTYGTQEITSFLFLSAFMISIRGLKYTEKERKRGEVHTVGCRYLQCSQEVPTLFYSAASSAQRGQSPDSDSVAALP